LCAERINNYVDVALFYVLHIIFWWQKDLAYTNKKSSVLCTWQ
jgi:hypothetical protein